MTLIHSCLTSLVHSRLSLMLRSRKEGTDRGGDRLEGVRSERQVNDDEGHQIIKSSCEEMEEMGDLRKVSVCPWSSVTRFSIILSDRKSVV